MNRLEPAQTMDYYANVPFDIDDRTEGDAQVVLTSLWGGVSVSAAGIVSNAVKAISYETGLSELAIIAALDKLEYMDQIVIDLGSGELLILDWLENNYLFDCTISQSPQNVLDAFELINSPLIKGYAERELDKLDVKYDAAIAGLKENPGEATPI